jgi:hypothetical protein
MATATQAAHHLVGRSAKKACAGKDVNMELDCQRPKLASGAERGNFQGSTEGAGIVLHHQQRTKECLRGDVCSIGVKSCAYQAQIDQGDDEKAGHKCDVDPRSAIDHVFAESVPDLPGSALKRMRDQKAGENKENDHRKTLHGGRVRWPERVDNTEER